MSDEEVRKLKQEKDEVQRSFDTLKVDFERVQAELTKVKGVKVQQMAANMELSTLRSENERLTRELEENMTSTDALKEQNNSIRKELNDKVFAEGKLKKETERLRLVLSARETKDEFEKGKKA